MSSAGELIIDAGRFVRLAAYAAEQYASRDDLADVHRQDTLDAIESAERRLSAARAALLNHHEEAQT